MGTFGNWHEDQNVTPEPPLSFRDRLAEKFALVLVQDHSRAAQVSIDALAAEGEQRPRSTFVAVTAYAIADAMLKAREKKQA